MPAKFGLPEGTAPMGQESKSLLIEPIIKSKLLDYLATLEIIHDEFPDVDQGLLPARQIDL